MTLDEVKPYVEARCRQQLFREAVIAFIGVESGDKAKNEYCETCRKAGLDNCATCDQQFNEAI